MRSADVNYINVGSKHDQFCRLIRHIYFNRMWRCIWRFFSGRLLEFCSIRATISTLERTKFWHFVQLLFSISGLGIKWPPELSHFLQPKQSDDFFRFRKKMSGLCSMDYTSDLKLWKTPLPLEQNAVCRLFRHFFVPIIRSGLRVLNSFRSLLTDGQNDQNVWCIWCFLYSAYVRRLR